MSKRQMQDQFLCGTGSKSERMIRNSVIRTGCCAPPLATQKSVENSEIALGDTDRQLRVFAPKDIGVREIVRRQTGPQIIELQASVIAKLQVQQNGPKIELIRCSSSDICYPVGHLFEPVISDDIKQT